MANNTNGKPVAEIRVGRITATIWQNTPTDDGVFLQRPHHPPFPPRLHLGSHSHIRPR